MMRLRILAFAVITATCAAQSPQYIQTCTGIGTPKVQCVYVPLSSIQVPGPRGVPGATGPQGIPGQNGRDGQNATITIGTVTALPPGSPPTVTNVGTPTNAILNFGLTTGNKGTDGTNGTNGTNGHDAQLPPGLTFSGKVLTWGDGTAGWQFILNSGGTMYVCTPQPGAFTCVAQ